MPATPRVRGPAFHRFWSAAVHAFAVILSISAPAVSAETPAWARGLSQFRIDRWDTPQGLPQSTVQAITGTRDGYLWVGTLEGLARFDGTRFTNFDARQVPELGAGPVHGLMQDREGNLWIGRSGAAVVYSAGRFRIMFDERTTAGAAVWGFAQAADGAVWAATNSGLVRWQGGSTRVFRVADGLPTDRLRAVAFDRDGVLWVGTTGGGLVSMVDGRFKVVTALKAFAFAEVRAVLPDPAGGVWAATAGGGLAHVAGESVSVWTTADGLPTNQLSALALDRLGSLWVGTWGSGLCRLADRKFSCLASPSGLPADQVWSMHLDREGSVWVGSWVQGLSRLRDRRFLAFGVPEGLSNDNVRSVLRAHDGAMWVATAGGGVNRIADGRVTTVRKRDGLPSDEASALWEDPDGSLWIGTYTSGLAHWSGGRVTTFTNTDGLPGFDVRAIHRDRRGTLWVATMSGVARLEGARFVAQRAEGIPLDGVVAMAEDRAGALWFGTAGRGVLRLLDGRFALYTTRDGLGSNKVMAFHEDRSGAMWIGTGGGGITRWRDGRFAAVDRTQGLWDGTVQTVVEDHSGTFWMTSNRGFFRATRADLDAVADGRATSLTSVGYDATDALRSTTFAGGQAPSASLDSAGRVWLPSYSGLVVVDTEHLPPTGQPPIARLEEMTANGTTGDPGLAVVLPPGSGTLVVRYTAITLLDAERVRFRWRMSGLSNDWVDAGTDREAIFTGLSAGRFRFEVMASGDGHVWSEASQPLLVTVQPHFYQTMWFWLLLAVVAVASVVGGIAWRIRLHRRREDELQQRVNQALAEVHTLSGLLPICAWCKKIRNDGGYWQQLEVYIHQHSQATFSHGICPDCLVKVSREDSGAS